MSDSQFRLQFYFRGTKHRIETDADLLFDVMFKVYPNTLIKQSND